jgi:hypothetical protein
MTDVQRHCIVTALSREKLDAKVFELMRLGWRPLGGVAAAKSVSESAPPYFCQSMICDGPPATDPDAQAYEPRNLPSPKNPLD